MVEAHPFLPNLDDETIERMLKQVKAGSVAELFSDIPEGLLLKRRLSIPDGEGEAVVRKELHGRLARNKTPPDALCFLGGGVWPHYIPAAVDSILSRQEFYTSYTPYQPEVSQGMLQALFEYQSMICRLTGMEVASSSHYNGATAMAEAVLLALNAASGKRSKVVISPVIHPAYREVLKTYLRGMPAAVVAGDEDGTADTTRLKSLIDEDTAALVIQNPNFFGQWEPAAELAEAIHSAVGLFIVVTDPI